MSVAWTPVRTADGTWTLRHPDHGQACHSLDGAWSEAMDRYARPCRVAARAREGVVRLLDLGTGVGWNLAAAVGEAQRSGPSAILDAWSFELDEAVLCAARDLASGPHPGPDVLHRRVLDTLRRAALQPWAEGEGGAEWGDPKGGLHLGIGDARVLLPALPEAVRFDVVFLDGFSPGVEGDLWEPAFLAEVARRMAPGSMLSTYTTSLRVRAALVAAGLRVGEGSRVGNKAAGTLASPDLEIPALPERTARKLARRLESSSESP